MLPGGAAPPLGVDRGAMKERRASWEEAAWVRSLSDRKLNRWRFLFQVVLVLVGLTLYVGFEAYDWASPGEGRRARASLPFAGARVLRIFYVNLDGSVARRATMEASLAAQLAVSKVPFERVRAVKGGSAADLAGELGEAVVAHHGRACGGLKRGARCAGFPAYDGNVGLCCVARSKKTPSLGRLAAERLTNASLGYRCAHWSAHASVTSIWGSPATCVRLAANWASHLKALDRARAALPRGRVPSRDDYVLVLEDDAALAPDWLARLRASSLAADGPLAAAASTRDRDAFDYVRVDLDAADVTFVDVGPKGGSRASDFAQPLLFDECYARLPARGYASWGASALLIRADSLAKVVAALSDCGMALDAMLNFATHLGDLDMAALAAPIAGVNASLNAASTIDRRRS